MKLATAQEVLDRMSMGNSRSGSITSADSVLNAATPIIENILGSPLEAADRIDYYDHYPSAFEGGTINQQIFYLEQMFVDGNIKVYVSEDGTPLNSLTGLTAITDGIQLRKQDGEFIFSNQDVYQGSSQIAVKYSAGFSDGSADVPSWLKEAAISSAIRVLQSQSVMHNKKDTIDMSRELHLIVYQQINNRIRPRYNGRTPANSVTL